MTSRLLIVLCVLVVLLTILPSGARATSSAAFFAQTQAAASDEQQNPHVDAPPTETPHHITAYTLPPNLYKRAKALSRIRFRSDLIGFVYSVLILWLVLHWKLAPTFRDWAEKSSSNRFLQAIIFSPILIVTLAILELPPALYDHWISRAYGISVEGWGPFFGDWAKGIFLVVVIGSFLVWILYSVVRRSPGRWWFYFWLISLPILVLMSFIEPFVIEPMFFQFAPLSQKDPELVAQIERVVRRAGVSIPPDRMFWMKASDKTPTLNEYVTGIGASKRIVIWDTSIAKETTPEIVADIGHEMGHYVLGHIWKGLIFSGVLALVLLYLGFWWVRWLLRHFEAGWKIRGVGDLACLPAFLLVLAILNFLSDPISNAYSRHLEHQADVYGLEVTHGVLPDAGQAAADSFEVEGRISLADPSPNSVNVFLFYDHPPISDRVRLCLTYDPWAKGKEPEFVR